jgi:threonine dehydratase
VDLLGGAEVGRGQDVQPDPRSAGARGCRPGRSLRGTHTYAVAAAHRPRLVAVPEGQICVEMLDLYQSDGIISEPAGALAPASLGLLDLPPGRGVPRQRRGGAA